MQLRYRSSRDLFKFEASHIEIITDFKELECPTSTKRAVFSPDQSQKKRKHKKSDQAALSGVLGLASLISDRDLEDKKLSEHWFQQYPLSSRNNWDYLPTGIPLQGKSLLTASFDVYYQDRKL
ncbi:hypothetical protein SteCoe_8070 [Stentor coeruleus]|uniref:Uncharacterized protein n=1 Tax=Stentor coeruleus TaxID=5963 RepID=A0A1R2CL66_9CILI|nr:hypothetical protein SteCoe_8070 [Stentor coeruleus]